MLGREYGGVGRSRIVGILRLGWEYGLILEVLGSREGFYVG